MRHSQTVPFNPNNQLIQHRPQASQVRALHDPRNDIQLQNIMGVGLMDDFFKDFLDFTRLEDEMFSFSNLHSRLGGRADQGTGYCMQVFSSVSSMGPDGQIKNEQYYENSLGHHSGGNTISQRQQAYQNSQGAARIAEERRLNDQGRKVISQKRGGETIQTNHFYNLDQGRIGQFDNRWNQVNNQTRFLENYGQMAPRQALDFGTVNRLVSQQPMRPQIEQGYSHPQYSNSNINGYQANTHTAVNTPLLQSTVQSGFNPLAITGGASRISNYTGSNTGNNINSLSSKYQVRN